MGYACAFAALAREIGYDPYVVCGRVPGTRDGAGDGFTRHSWVIINGLHYDPEGQLKAGIPEFMEATATEWTIRSGKQLISVQEEETK